MRDPELWARISNYTFPAYKPPVYRWFGGNKPQKTRLQFMLESGENWADDYALRAIDEYRRFIYLSLISDEKITPSKVVDAVWHSHMADSKDYVEAFSQPLAERVVHHEPGLSDADSPRFEAQYEQTRALYKKEFQADPPGDIWTYRSESQIARDEAKSHIAILAGFVGGLSVAALGRAGFGLGLGALVAGAIAGFAIYGFIAPKVPGPKYRSSDASGCGSSGCGD